jgi:hypothetical protein
MRITYHRAFHHIAVHIDGVLHFGCTNPVAAYIEYIINTAGDAVIAIFIPQGAIAGKI